MKFVPPALLFALVFSTSSYAEASLAARRDKALEQIKSCLQRNDVSSRQCSSLNKNVETLVEVYEKGDKSVLPTLFQFTYLTDFYDDALLADPKGFLSALALLSKEGRQSVALGVAGGTFGLHSKKEFDVLRALLASVQESSSSEETAQQCLHALESNNASFFVDYFPPHTFTSRSATFQIHWYSRDMYALGEKPIWQTLANGETTYRLTLLSAFSGPRVITLSIMPNGTGSLTIKSLNNDRLVFLIDEQTSVSTERVIAFRALIDKAQYWRMPAEIPDRGMDGADWILEGLQSGTYHVAIRWCPDNHPHSEQEAAFAKAASMLFEFAGHKLK